MAEKSLYYVEITTEYMVMATSAKEAEQLVAKKISPHELKSQSEFSASLASYIPWGWDDIIPYGEEKNRTCAEILKEHKDLMAALKDAYTPDPRQITIDGL